MAKNKTIGLGAGFLLSILLIISCTSQVQEQGADYSGKFDPVYEPIIDSVIQQLTLAEKVHLIHGDGMFVTGGVERLGIPELKFTDGPSGVREEMERNSWRSLNLSTDSATFFPTGTALAASWNEDLAFAYGKALGSEANARGKHVLLGPGVNIIRSPLCGRNFEYFSEDPFLNSRIAVGYVKGVQSQHVAACVKHYAANNQEYERGRVSVEMDERTLREIYLPAYKAIAQEAEAYTVMAAYNKFRGEWMGENDYLLNQVLKNEWGYPGAVISDWAGTHSTVKAALSGLDVEMGGKLENMYFSTLEDSVIAGLIPESIIDDKVRRVLRIGYNCRLNDETRTEGVLNGAESKSTAYLVASESIVLLKNENDLLPLDFEEFKRIAVIGKNATKPQSIGGFTAGVKARYEISPLEAIRTKFGDQVEVQYCDGYEEILIPEDIGRNRPKYSPGKEANQELLDEAVALAKESDIALIIAGTSRELETEVSDRESIDLPYGQDELIRAVSSVNPNTIVVIVAGAACDLNVTDESVSTILYSWFNGSEAGNALADVLSGEVNPSGKLPFSIPMKLEDVGAHALDAFPGENLTVEYKEGILVGYRWFDTKAIQPRFCFGHGLSYTSFDYSNLEIQHTDLSKHENLKFSVIIENSGNADGKETVQVYTQALTSDVDRPQKELKSFQKIELEMGDSQELDFSIPLSKLAYYNEDSAAWIIEPGRYNILIGSSSRDIRETAEFSIY